MDMLWNVKPEDEKTKPIVVESRTMHIERVNWDVATYGDILKWLRENENATWDENISYMGEDRYNAVQVKPSLKNIRWVSVYCVHGGSEGIYLHIDFIDSDDKRDLKFVGKTLSSGPRAMQKCYESAGRIAVFLQA